MTLPGTLTLYYGEELGMTNVAIPPEEIQDPAEKNEPGIGQGRDPERTPMLWDGSPNAGFTTGRPWLPLGDYTHNNVATLEGNATSILHLYRRLIALRDDLPVLIGGEIEDIAAQGNILRYRRTDSGQRLQVLLNLGHEPARVAIEDGTILLSTFLDREGVEVRGAIDLRPAEAVILRLS